MSSRGKLLPALTKAWIAVSTSIEVLRLSARASAASCGWSRRARQIGMRDPAASTDQAAVARAARAAMAIRLEFLPGLLWIIPRSLRCNLLGNLSRGFEAFCRE